MNASAPEFKILAAISESLREEYLSENKRWDGSPFAWIKTRPSRQVGVIGEKMVSGWLAARGFNVNRSPDSDADRIIEGKRIEIKFSTLWESGVYKFQQLRDQNYDLVVCLGVSPFDAHCWVIPKSDIIKLWKVEKIISGQHGGQDGADTAWIDVRVSQPPVWLLPYGGSLSEAIRKLADYTGYNLKSISQELQEIEGN